MSNKPLTVLGWTSPNSYKVTIYLEELKAGYGTAVVDYDFHPINLGKDVQKEPWYLKINPNGRLPALVDHSRGDFNVFESAAILLYLGQHHDTPDTEHQFSFDPVTEPNAYSKCLQWILFNHAGIGPMQGQLVHYTRFAPEKTSPYVINRYLTETRRLYGVLEIRLKGGREYLAGPGKGKYSVTDLNALPWVRLWSVCDVESMNDFPNVTAWIKRLEPRPAVQEGFPGRRVS